MLTVIVSFKVKSEDVQAFVEATSEETLASLKYSGVVQIDVLRASDDAAHFTLHEVFATRAVGLQHLGWRISTSGKARSSQCWTSRRTR